MPGIADTRTYLRDALDALPPDTSPIDKIMTAVEAHLRHEVEVVGLRVGLNGKRGAAARARLPPVRRGGIRPDLEVARRSKHLRMASSATISTLGSPSC